MDFTELYKEFKKSLDGTDSYRELNNGLTRLIAEDYPNAAIYFTLQSFASSYVMLYSDQGITPDFAQRAKLEMLKYLDMVLPAFQGIFDPATSLSLLSQMIVEYTGSKKIF